MSFILGDGIVVEVEEPLPTPVDVDPPALVEVMGPPEISFDIDIATPPVIEMDTPDVTVLVLPVPGAPGRDGDPGPPGDGAIIVDETPIGALDGVNMTYLTAFEFRVDTTQVYLNGLRQRRPFDYSEDGTTGFSMTAPPEPTDSLTIDYSLS